MLVLKELAIPANIFSKEMEHADVATKIASSKVLSSFLTINLLASFSASVNMTTHFGGVDQMVGEVNRRLYL